MNEYKIFVSSKELASPLKKGLDNLKNDDSVIGKDSSIKVDGITIEEADVVVLLRDAEADILSRAQTNSKPVLLCDIDCSKFEKPNSAAIPFTWGLFSKNNKDMKRLSLIITTCHLYMTMLKISWIIFLRWYSTCLRSFLTIASIIQILDIRNKRSSSTNSPSSISTR